MGVLMVGAEDSDVSDDSIIQCLSMWGPIRLTTCYQLFGGFHTEEILVDPRVTLVDGIFLTLTPEK